MEVVVTDPKDFNPTKTSIGDEEECKNGFEIDFIDVYEDSQTSEDT